MSGKILQVFNFLDIHSNDFLKILLIAGGWGVGGWGVMGNFGTNLVPKWCVFITLYPLLESF